VSSGLRLYQISAFSEGMPRECSDNFNVQYLLTWAESDKTILKLKPISTAVSL